MKRLWKRLLIPIASGLFLLLIMIFIIYETIVSVLVLFNSQSQPAGYNLPPFVTDDMMQAFFETQKEYGIPVSSGVAQLIAESGFGSYGPGGEAGQGLSSLAYKYHNLFGIKYFSGDRFASGSVNMITGEETTGGDLDIITAAFSIYPTYGDCIRQRARMLSLEPYYSRTIAKYKNPNDGSYTVTLANSFMSGIREAGWATDTSYVTKCVTHMQTYNLYQFDNMTWEDYQNGQASSGGGTTPGSGYLANPCPVAYISSEFGGRTSPGGIGSTNHKGRDYAAPSGTPIYAAADGSVIQTSYNNVRGYYIQINHGNGLKTLYQHCSRYVVAKGQKVNKGQIIAYVGNTGASTGPHLHFEVWENDVPVDPRNYL